MQQRAVVVAAALDLALVALFVVIGRASHEEAQDGFLVTFWPFGVGLAVGWLVTRAWRNPLAVGRTGLPVWAAIVVVGVLLRALAGQGVQVAFVVVTAIVLGALLLGWRVLLLAVERSRGRGPGGTGPIGALLDRRR